MLWSIFLHRSGHPHSYYSQIFLPLNFPTRSQNLCIILNLLSGFSIQIKQIGFHFLTVSTAFKDLQDQNPNIYTMLLISSFLFKKYTDFLLEKMTGMQKRDQVCHGCEVLFLLSYLIGNPHYGLCYCYSSLVFPNLRMRKLGQEHCEPEQQMYQNMYFCSKTK